jgi:hypothetical protein
MSEGIFRIMPDEIVLHIAEFLPTVNIHFLKFMFQCLRYTYRTCYDSVTAARSAALHNQTDLAMKISEHCQFPICVFSAEMIAVGYHHVMPDGLMLRYRDIDYATALIYARDKPEIVEHVLRVYTHVTLPIEIVRYAMCMNITELYDMELYQTEHLVVACGSGSEKILEKLYAANAFTAEDVYFILKNIPMIPETMMFLLELVVSASGNKTSVQPISGYHKNVRSIVNLRRPIEMSIYIANSATYLQTLCDTYGSHRVSNDIKDINILYAANNSDLAIKAYNLFGSTLQCIQCLPHCSNKNVIAMLEKELISCESIAVSAVNVGDMRVLNYIREHDPKWKTILCDAVGISLRQCTKKIIKTRPYYLALWLSHHKVPFKKLARRLHGHKFCETMKKHWHGRDNYWIEGFDMEMGRELMLNDNPHRENGYFSEGMFTLLEELKVHID